MAEHNDDSPNVHIDSQGVSHGLLSEALGASVFCSLLAIVGLLLLTKDLSTIVIGIALGSIVGVSLARADRTELWGMPISLSSIIEGISYRLCPCGWPLII